jgi:hypothetical protein
MGDSESKNGNIEVVPLLRQCAGCRSMTERGCFWATWCASLARDPEGKVWVCARPFVDGRGPVKVARSELSRPPRALR